MAMTIIITAIALLNFLTVNAASISVGEFGVGMVVYRQYERIGPTLDFQQSSTILLHITGRRPETHHYVQRDTVILNTRTGWSWGSEERPTAFQFQPAPTSITEVVEVTESGYDIAMNGHHYVYNHRLDVTRVTSLWSALVTPPSIGRVLNDYSMGRVIYIKATAPTTGDFKIELLPLLPREITSQWQKVSLVLHSQFSATPPAVTRNTYGPTCGGVELGESDGGMPFVAGEPFQLTIVAQQFGFEIGVNGSHFASYSYRTPLTKHMTVMLTNVPTIETIQYY